MAGPLIETTAPPKQHPSRAVIRGSSEGGFDGEVVVDGFKHAFVTVAGATLLGHHRFVIHNTPRQTECQDLVALLRDLGLRVDVDGTRMVIDHPAGAHGPYDGERANRIHGSLYLTPGLLVRHGVACVRGSGGCQIGSALDGARPVSQYAEVIERFGGTYRLDGAGGIELAAEQFTGCDIDLRDFSDSPGEITGARYSGATKFAIMCAVSAHGMTRLVHPYPKADVLALVSALEGAGADIVTEDDDTVRIARGSLWEHRRTVHHHLVPDLIQTITWICFAVTTNSRVHIRGAADRRLLDALAHELAALTALGVSITTSKDGLIVNGRAGKLRAIDLEAAPRTVFSDAQPFFALLMTRAPGTSTIVDRVWPDRFTYARQLRKLGCDMRVIDGVLTIEGARPPSVRDAQLHADDLRSAATLLLAATAVDGETQVTGLDHLSRGYADLPGQLAELGVDIST